jgi:hypothetical protein
MSPRHDEPQAPVSVLAIIDRAWAKAHGDEARDLYRARTAIAELLESSRRACQSIPAIRELIVAFMGADGAGVGGAYRDLQDLQQAVQRMEGAA